jgi:hypothetical protein
MVRQIFDNKIDETKLIELKIPVHFPTMTDWTEYAVIEGQIQWKDGYYNYVKLKMTRDTMYFICIPNTAKTRLVQANITTAKEISDAPLTKKGHDASFKKVNTLSEYNLKIFHYDYSGVEKLLTSESYKSASLKLCRPYIMLIDVIYIELQLIYHINILTCFYLLII